MQIPIAENIKKFRMASGYTQSDIAILLSVSPQAVSRWENGQAFPDITFLPLLAKHLNVTIDELMGQEGQRNKSLKKELNERRQAKINDEFEMLENEIRILEIYEELGHTENLYLHGYFQQLMRVKNNEKLNLNIKGLDEQIANARQMLQNRIRTSTMSDRMFLLNTVASFEEEDQLELWADEYTLPEYMKSNIWDELMLSRYLRENNIDKAKNLTQKILYQHIKNIVFYLTDSVFNLIKEKGNFHHPARYKLALDTLALYSTQVDDIFIFNRIIAEERYAWALLFNGRVEDSLAMFSEITEHLSILYHLPDGCVLHGSVPVLNAVHIAIDMNAKQKCAMNMGGYEKNPLFDKIRTDKRFIECMNVLQNFLPQQKSRVWVSENGSDTLDTQWEMLLNRANEEAKKLSDGDVVVMLTAKGTVTSISFQNIHSAIEAENAMRFLIEKKKEGESQIKRLICMWHDGSVDLPSYAFREALVDIDSKNLSTQILLNGLGGYVVKTVKATMPKGYKA